MKVAVLMGGRSSEREISFRSGRAVSKALRARGHDVFELDARGPSLMVDLEKNPCEVAFVALHGKFGEDGTIQGLLEWMQIPYTGCSVFTSALCFNKKATKEVLRNHGVKTPDHATYQKGEDYKAWIDEFSLSYPVIVKPNSEGSSVGITRVWKSDELSKAISEALRYDSILIIEELIQGREVTAGVHRGRALPLVEIIPTSGFYDYQAKYTKGMTTYIVPAKMAKAQTEKIQKGSEEIYSLLNCEGTVRIDYMLSKDGTPFFLEVNTIPGMTETSLLPKAAEGAGIPFDGLCEEMLFDARLRSAQVNGLKQRDVP